MKLIGKIALVMVAAFVGYLAYESLEQLILDGDCIELYLPVEEHRQLCKD
jgi:hypothetical protein